MSGFSYGGNDLDNIFATYAANTGFSIGFIDVTLDGNNQNTNPGQRVGYKTSKGYDLSQRYVELTKLGPSLKAEAAGACNYKYGGGGGTDIGPLYAKKDKVEWSAAITAITSVALANSNNVTFSFNFAGYPTSIDAYLTGSNYSSTTNFGGSLPAIGQTAGGSGTLTVNSLPADTQISYQLRSYITGVTGPNMSYPSTAATFYTHPILSAPTTSSTGLLTNGNTKVDYIYTLNSGDKYQYVAVFTDSGCSTRYDSTKYTPGKTITFNASKGSYHYWVAPYDQFTLDYNRTSGFVYDLSFTISAGSMSYVDNNSNIKYDSFVVRVNVINVGAITATNTTLNNAGSVGSFTTYSGSSQTVSITFSDSLKPVTQYNYKITGTLGDGTTVDIFGSQTTISNVSVALSRTVPNTNDCGIFATAENATGGVKLSNGSDLTVQPSGQYYVKVTGLDSDKSYSYTVTATGDGGGTATASVNFYTLPILTAVTSTAGDGQVVITFTGTWSGAQLWDGSTKKQDNLTSGTAYTFTGLTNGTSYNWTVKLLNRNTNAYDQEYSSTSFAGLSFTPKLPGTIIPDGGPTPVTVNGYNIMYITSTTTLTFTGAYFYYFIIMGSGANTLYYPFGGSVGGGGSGGLMDGYYKSTTGDKLTIIFIQHGSNDDPSQSFTLRDNNTGTDIVTAGPGGRSTEELGGPPGNITYVHDTTLLSRWRQGGGGGNYEDFTKFFTVYDSNYHGQSQRNPLPPYVEGNGQPSSNITNNGPGGGGGAGGAASNDIGGQGYIWFIDRITYATGGSVSDSTTTYGSGGSGKNNGQEQGKGNSGLFAIAWRA